MSTTLNKELMTRWIEALESGRYLQGQGSLRNEDMFPPRYCCLGVLQHIEPTLPDDEEMYLKQDSVKRVLGCELNQVLLAEMNDGIDSITGLELEPKSFREIAQYLRKTYKIG